jgi:hypothetical protein
VIEVGTSTGLCRALVGAIFLILQAGCAGRQDLDLGDAQTPSSGAPSDSGGSSNTGGSSTNAGREGQGGDRPDEGGSSSASTGGTPEPGPDCSALETELSSQLADLQSCETDDECGESIAAGNCGCTHAVPIRKSVNRARVAEYVDLAAKVSQCTMAGGSVCNCPPADGFVCRGSKCAWNFLD